ncbi:dynamin family protein [Butyrivibrio sp. VCB2001]|uniref:dynamin family protein n=1 Tax=Butyrivibrio sp. VCB2001 TaxID=1280667 RepID=UPI0004247083|nr:dynamin family protein [Butyrivibrio sp. VCB2001]
MLDRQTNANKAKLALMVAEKYGFDDIVTGLKQFEKINENYKAHILLIGGYSAGKSALLNKFIGKDVLVENQGPETNVATELYYSVDEKILANNIDGTVEEISSPDSVDVSKTRNIKYYINSENIRTQNEYVIVDTPGFDSGIEAHNKALMQYIDRGTAFILVIDCEKGTISDSALDFLNEAMRYSTNISVIINKCDKKTPQEVQDIKNHIEELLLGFCGVEFNVVCTSIHDPEVTSQIKSVIQSFDSRKMYEQYVTARLQTLLDSLLASLRLLKEKQKCDTYEIDEEIRNREYAKEKLLEQIASQKKRLSIKLHNEVKEKILSKMHSQLMVNAPILADAYKGGVELFQQRIIEIIRPILITEVEGYSAVACDDFIKHLNYSSLENVKNSEEIAEIVNNVYNKIVSLNEAQNLLCTNIDSSVGDDETRRKVKAAYKTITSLLAITTEVVAPPLELIIVFLPDILKFLGTLTGNTEEQQLVDAIQKKIIPQVIAKIRVELDSSLSDVEDAMIESISSNIEEILEIENEALEIAKKRKEESIADYESFVAEIDADIAALRK